MPQKWLNSLLVEWLVCHFKNVSANVMNSYHRLFRGEGFPRTIQRWQALLFSHIKKAFWIKGDGNPSPLQVRSFLIFCLRVRVQCVRAIETIFNLK